MPEVRVLNRVTRNVASFAQKGAVGIGLEIRIGVVVGLHGSQLNRALNGEQAGRLNEKMRA